MTTVRCTTNEVQVGSTIYSFGTVREADAFEACVAAVDAEHCEIQHRPVGKRPVAVEPLASDDSVVL